jgi:hypothetical protein
VVGQRFDRLLQLLLGLLQQDVGTAEVYSQPWL